MLRAELADPATALDADGVRPFVGSIRSEIRSVLSLCKPLDAVARTPSALEMIGDGLREVDRKLALLELHCLGGPL